MLKTNFEFVTGFVELPEWIDLNHVLKSATKSKTDFCKTMFFYLQTKQPQ